MDGWMDEYVYSYVVHYVADRACLSLHFSPPPFSPATPPSQFAQVSCHEPWTALDGGQGPGIDVLRAICEEASAVLAPGGYIGMETGGGQQPVLIAQTLRELAFVDVTICNDLFGVPRFVSGFKAS